MSRESKFRLFKHAVGKAMFTSGLVVFVLASSTAGATVLSTSLLQSQIMASGRSCVPEENLDETADSFISRCKKSSIRQVFPGELLGRTLGEILSGTSAAHRRAQKLLKRRIYDKFEAAPSIDPSTQVIVDAPAFWNVTVNRDPNYEEVLIFHFGDGMNSRTVVGPGPGTIVITITHYPSSGGTVWTQQAYVDGGFSDDGVTLPNGDASQAETQQGC